MVCLSRCILFWSLLFFMSSFKKKKNWQKEKFFFFASLGDNKANLPFEIRRSALLTQHSCVYAFDASHAVDHYFIRPSFAGVVLKLTMHFFQFIKQSTLFFFSLFFYHMILIAFCILHILLYFTASILNRKLTNNILQYSGTPLLRPPLGMEIWPL